MDGQSAQFRLHIPGYCANALLVPQTHQSMKSHVAVRLNRFRIRLARHRTRLLPRRSACELPLELFLPAENPASYFPHALRGNRSRLKGENP